MKSILQSERTAKNVTDAYVASRRRSCLISTTKAIQAIRYLLPACAASDRELADLVATSAIARGVAVCFDATGTKDTTETPATQDRAG